MVIAAEEQRLGKPSAFDFGGVESATIGVIAERALVFAKLENRLIVGLSGAVGSLAETPDEFLFCFMAPPIPGDSATHMQEVLLQAFCFEHDIYIIKIDSAEKLSRLLGSSTMQSCALIQKNWVSDNQTEVLSKVEDQLVDFCEAHWESPVKPIVKLPEK
ncbi:uncharacterized protein LOC129770526 [Toxorhynchites rutilus septentrionalis]|uniref:uncharacterized protein LOC129770526 n=1 Tax=Toxorhynchites rutilus septentrionalis TaxID=329112 RepID=UPI002478F8D1|nr:uncharacterized protein LOC129770526 [Toxorhynchites rutilus septentrionalis]